MGKIEKKYQITNRRYTGSKLKIKEWIKKLIIDNCPNSKTFCDIFAGTSVVTDEVFIEYEKIILNDLLYSNEVIYKAFYMNEEFNMEKILNYKKKYQSIDKKYIKGNYVSINYGNRYFNNDDAKLIGYIREDIENNKSTLNEREYCILLASLLYSLDKCANTVGHYDAYFKNKELNSIFEFNLIQPYNTILLGKNLKYIEKMLIL